MNVPQTLREIADAILNQDGLPWFTGLAITTLARIGIALWERKRLSYEVVYNSKIGFHRPFDPGVNQDAQVESMLRNFNNVSVLVVRLWNSSMSKITSGDYARPLYLAFSDRYIVDFRLSEMDPRDLVGANQIAGEWTVGKRLDEPNLPTITQSQLRGMLPDSLEPAANGGPSENQRNSRKRLLIPRLELDRNNSLKIVVCLREDEELQEDAPNEKEYEFAGETEASRQTCRSWR